MRSQKSNIALGLSCLLPLITGCGSDDAVKTSVQAKPAAASTLTPLQRGERIYTRCRACHTLGEGEKNKVGPNLHGVMGRVAGSKDNFPYSKAMTASEIIWTDETLNAYLTRPRDFMPGNRMSFIGLKHEIDRAAVIAYIRLKTEPKTEAETAKTTP